MDKAVPIVVLFISLTCALEPMNCPEKISNKYSITWTETASCTVSQPLCLDDSWTILKRCCTEGVWETEPACKHTQVVNPCPEDQGFSYDQSKKICYSLSAPGAFPPKCPYPDVLPFETYKSIITKDMGPVWMPVTRDLSNGLGFLQWIEASTTYRNEYTGLYRIIDNILGNNCLLFYNDSYITLVKCSEVHSAVCAYSEITEKQNLLCDSCLQSDFTPTSKCFCTEQISTPTNLALLYEPPRTLAEFSKPYQSFLYNLLTSQPCLFGLLKIEGKFVWAQSKTSLKYSFWSPNTNFEANNRFGVFTTDGWTLTDEQNDANCIIYQTDVSIEKPSLDLTYDEKADRLVVTANSVKSLKWVKNKKNELTLLINCFTDAIPMDLMYKYLYLEQVSKENLDDQITYKFSSFKNGPGNYWCEAFEYPDLKVVKSKTLLFNQREDFAAEYAAVLRASYVRGSDPLSSASVGVFERVLAIKLKDIPHLSQNYNTWFRIFKILNIDEESNKIVFNLHFSLKKASSIDPDTEIPVLKDLLKKSLADVTQINFEVLDVLSTDFCTKETTNDFNVVLNWPKTLNGTWSYPEEYCFTSKGHRVNRLCDGSFIDGSSWSEIEEYCEVVPPTLCAHYFTTYIICENCTTDEIMNETTAIIVNNLDEIGPLDVYLIGDVLNNIKNKKDEKLNVTLFSQMIGAVNKIAKNTLKEAQDKLNATDRILYLIDEIVLSSSVNNLIAKADNFTIVLESAKNFTGAALYQYNDDYEIKIFNTTINITDTNIINEKDLISVMIFDPKLVQQIQSNSSITRILLTLFMDHNLFNTNKTYKNPHYISKIFGVVIPGLSQNFTGPIYIYYKIKVEHENEACSYWNYGNYDRGDWKMENEGRITEGFSVCQYLHTTHFAMLLLPDDKYAYFSYVLDLITLINCSLSLIGLVGILLTGILFKQWRMNTGNQILTNFALAVCFQLALFYVSGNIDKELDIVCIVIGVILHYSVLSQFFWMFVIAILQFRRFVEVLGGPPKYVLLKACVCGWGIPLIPVICVCALDPYNYVESTAGLCYPSGLGLFLGVWLPIGIIVVINCVIFVYIIFHVVHRKTECVDVGSNEIVFQWKLAILLFFMLGLTWLFAFLAELDFGLIFSILFCFTATLQGFVMFLFFILFNKSSRNLYLISIKRCLRGDI